MEPRRRRNSAAMARERNLGGAAEQLHIAQPALSRRSAGRSAGSRTSPAPSTLYGPLPEARWRRAPRRGYGAVKRNFASTGAACPGRRMAATMS